MEVEPAFFVIAAAAVLLALLNSLVVNAARQLLEERKDKQLIAVLATTELPSKQSELGQAEFRRDILPAPVLYTDRFWLLLQAEN